MVGYWLECLRQGVQQVGSAECLEVSCELAGTVGVSEQQPGLDVPLLRGFGEIGRGDQDRLSVDRDELGVEACPLFAVHVQGARIVPDLGAGLPRPVLLPELLGKTQDDAFVGRGVGESPTDIHVQDYLDGRRFLHPLGQGFENGSRLMEGVTRDDNLGLSSQK